MNQFTIEFKNPKDLAKKIAEYNELMNPKSIEELAVKVVEEPKQETTPKVVEKPQPERDEPVEEVAEVPVTNFEGEPVEVKSEEVEEPAEEITANELDVETAEIDPQVYWNDFKDWLKHVGAEGVKAALDVFRNHGVNGKPNSGDLTPEIIKELDALMGK